MKSKARRKQSKGSSPSKPKEFHLTQGELSEWKSILAEFDELEAKAFDFQAAQAAHNAGRARFWARVCRRLGIRTDEVDTTKPVLDTIYLKTGDLPEAAIAPGAPPNPQHKQDEGNAK